jgi:hypothetical protein
MKKVKTPKIISVMVNPGNIDEHVDKCKSNRQRTRKHVNTWKRAVKKGYFRDGGIIFADENGDYDDAQHRLHALKEMYAAGETDQPFIFHIVTGMDRQTLNMMVDAGRKRSNTDRLKAMQVKYATLVNKGIEEIIDLTESWRKYAQMLLPDETLAFYREHRHELDYLAKAYYDFPNIQDAVLVAFAYVFKRIDEKKCNDYFYDLTHPGMLKAGQPLKAFYDMLGSQKLIMTEETALRNRYIKNGLIVAWNAHLKGESLELIELADTYLPIEGLSNIVQPAQEQDEDETGKATGTETEDESEGEAEDEAEDEGENGPEATA